MTFVVQLLNEFDKAVPRTGDRIMYVDQLGQYLNYKNLHTPLTSKAKSEWVVMLESNDCLHDYVHIMKQNLNLSLLECSLNLDIVIDNIFIEAYQDLKFVIFSTSFKLFQSLASRISSQIVTNNGSLLLAINNTERNTLNFLNIEQTDLSRVPFEESLLDPKMITIDINHKQGW